MNQKQSKMSIYGEKRCNETIMGWSSKRHGKGKRKISVTGVVTVTRKNKNKYSNYLYPTQVLTKPFSKRLTIK
jgi:hypothetical protein